MEQIQIQELTQEQIQAIQQTPLEIMNYKTKTLHKIAMTIYQTAKADQNKIPMMDKEIYKYPMLMKALTIYSNLYLKQALLYQKQEKILLQEEMQNG